MKWFKYFLPVIPLIVLSLQLFYYINSTNLTQTDLLTKENQTISKLNQQLHLSQLNYSDFQVFKYRHEVEFVVDPDTNPIKVIISLKKDTFSQVAALQNLLKKDNIKKEVKLIDLSSTPAYATFQNI